eukprot:5266309-Prymnesium_polylepis.1
MNQEVMMGVGGRGIAPHCPGRMHRCVSIQCVPWFSDPYAYGAAAHLGGESEVHIGQCKPDARRDTGPSRVARSGGAQMR